MPTSLEGSVALITGASSGIGLATATRLAAGGATVAIAARREDRLRDLEEQIHKAGGRALVLGADVTDPVQAKAIVDQTVAELGSLDILVNNAGIMLLGPAAGASLDDWDRMIDLNVKALLHVTHAAIPHLLASAEGERGVADLVNISSVAGRVARAGSNVYNASKWGVGAFTESLRQEFTKRHLRVSVVEPGATATELASHLSPQAFEGFKQRFAQGEFELLEAEDIADAIEYIVTRSRHIAINEILIRPTQQDG
jgi:NADP-dependent 3-hydroxy acid dehydrogenase YdfG